MTGDELFRIRNVSINFGVFDIFGIFPLNWVYFGIFGLRSQQDVGCSSCSIFHKCSLNQVQ